MTDQVQKIVVGEKVIVKVASTLPGPPGPPGVGDMQKLIYDPQNKAADTFNLANMTGSLDAGTF